MGAATVAERRFALPISARGLSLVAAATAVIVQAAAVVAARPGYDRWNEVAVTGVIAAWTVVGVLILWHRAGHPVGVLALGVALLWAIGEVLVAGSSRVLVEDPDHTWVAFALVLGTVARDLPWTVTVMWLPLRFPHWDPLRTRLARVAARIAVVGIAGLALVDLVSPRPTIIRLDDVENPIGLRGSLIPAVDVLSGVSLLAGLVAVLLAVLVLAQRYRGGGPLDRQQTLWFGLAFALPIPTFVGSALDTGGPWLFAAASLPLPVAIGFAILQRRLYDLPFVVNRSLTYAALSLAIAGLYAITVGGVGVAFGQTGATWLPWLAAGIVAVSFAPLRGSLQRAANRLTYGQWSHPDEVLASTARQLHAARDLPSLLQELTDNLATALGLAFVALTDTSGHRLAGHGAAPQEENGVDGLPMTSYGVPVGRLTWGRRPLRDSDRTLLEDLAGQLGTVVHAAGLLEAVRASQERLVMAREEERRRLRRDLHDGLGPALAGLTLRVDTLRNQLDAPAHDGLLELRSGIASTVVDVRRIVEGLRPPALDDLGLVDAVGVLGQRLTTGADVDVAVHAGDLPRLAAAVEVAAYRIVQEALTNAVRHSSGSHAVVELRHDGESLVVTVRDNGCGGVSPRVDGIGLSSMRARAEEIGGTFSMQSGAGRGTCVRVRLPA